MENAYQPELWHDLYVMLGTSSAALMGLLFVVTSLHMEDTIRNPVFRVRTRNVTIILLTTLIMAVMILTPQSSFAMGSELVIINLFGVPLPLHVIYLLRKNSHYQYASFPISRAVMVLVGYLLGIAGGIGLIEQSHWGLYIVTIAYVVLIAAIVAASWAFMLEVGGEGKRKKR